MAVLAVDSEKLKRAADEIERVGDLVSGTVRLHDREFAAQGQAGWEAAAQLSTAAPTWIAYLQGLSAAIVEKSSDLRALADTFVAANRDAERPWGARRVPE